MNGTIFTRLTGTKRNLLALLASSAMLTAGCANMASAPAGGNPFATAAAVSGNVHGGNQPVSNAVVNLYFAGEAPNPAVLVATTKTGDGTNAPVGTFAFTPCVPSDGTTCPANSGTTSTYSCPTGNDDPLVYVIATGGNTVNDGNSATNNTAAAFIGVFGDCKELNHNFISLSEVTTVATMAAMQQFFDPATGFISTDSTGNQKTIIDNTVNTINHLVNLATGTAVTSTTIGPDNGNGVTGVSVTATPEYQKINSLANILASCVNNADATASQCTTLFANAKPPVAATTSRPPGTVFQPATTVLQAIYYMLTNPTNTPGDITTIFKLIPAVGAPYAGLASVPTDWTIAINYSSTSPCGTPGGTFISQPYDISVDRIGNVWFANSSATGNLSELGANGGPTNCIFLSGGSHGGATIDSSGNIWLGTTSSNNLYRYNPANNTSLPFPTAAPPLGVTADGLGVVYFTTAAGNLYRVPNAAVTAAATTPVLISSVVGSNPIRLMPDFQGTSTQSNIWVSSGSTYVSRVTPAAAGPNFVGGFSTTQFTTGLDSYGVTVAYGNEVFVSSAGGDNYVTLLTGSGTNYTTPAGWPVATGAGGINNPTASSIDGADNVWIPNNTNASTTVGSVSEISTAAIALSPVTTGFQKDSTFLSSGRASVVDQAGNVWVVGDGPSGTPSNYITEIVGAGVPIYQPVALGLSNGRFQQQP
jgi:hypothetical protein